MASAPAFAATPRLAVGQISAANTGRDGTGTVVTVFTAGASGSRVYRIDISPVGTTTAGIVRLFIHDNTNYRLFREVLIAAKTPSGTVAADTTTITFPDGIQLPNLYSIRASTHNAETFNLFVEGGDY